MTQTDKEFLKKGKVCDKFKAYDKGMHLFKD